MKEYTCNRCQSEMTTNGKGELTPLTTKFKEINFVLEGIHKKEGLKDLKDFLFLNIKSVPAFGDNRNECFSPCNQIHAFVLLSNISNDG